MNSHGLIPYRLTMNTRGPADHPQPIAQAALQPALNRVRIVAGEKPQHTWRGMEVVVVTALLFLIGAGAAVASVSAQNSQAEAASATKTSPADVLRLGYFGNVTHAPALVGVEKGIFAKDLGVTSLETQVFTAGPATVEALNAGAIDAAYLGPNPALNSFVQSGGESVRIIAGAASGGAQFVVSPNITDIAQLRGKTIATAQLGGTQDVALRKWLGDHGLHTDTSGGGDVFITPTASAQTLRLFQDGKIDGAWVAEPWASRMVLEAKAKVLVNEADLWDNGKFSTTVLVVNKAFLKAHPQTVQALLAGHLGSLAWLEKHPSESAAVINDALRVAIGQPLDTNVIVRALSELNFTADPLAGTFPTLLEHGVGVGVSKPGDLNGLFELNLLNQILSAAGGDPVPAAGLGTE